MNDPMPGLRETPSGATIELRVQPGAPRCAVVREKGGRLKVRVDAPPVEGAANKRLLRYLARDVFGIPQRDVVLLRGESSRDKAVAIAMPVAEVRRALARALGEDDG